MLFSDLTLSRRLERAEGRACVEFAAARRRLFPDSGAEWIECAGTYAVFDGIDSPVTQTFGLGLFEEFDAEDLKTIEEFFRDRKAPVMHEVSPFAGTPTMRLLCENAYQPIEISNVLCQAISKNASALPLTINVRVVDPDDFQLWSDISSKGWSHEHPELAGFLKDLGNISAQRAQTFCFLADFEGQSGAAGALCIHEGVALFGGSATIPELRRRGLQTALLQHRMRFAYERGCDVAMIVSEPGSKSHRNAERSGFRVGYTRTKWRLLNERSI